MLIKKEYMVGFGNCEYLLTVEINTFWNNIRRFELFCFESRILIYSCDNVNKINPNILPKNIKNFNDKTAKKILDLFGFKNYIFIDEEKNE